MATLYLKTAGGNFNGANWSTTGSGGVDSVTPTAADDCIAELLSGDLTINSGSVCRSFDTTSGTGSYAGTITHSASVTWNIGDATAGVGNVAMKLNSGVTYSATNATTSIIAFISTSATTQTIDFSGKSTGSVTFNASSNGSWQYTGAHVTATTSVFTLTKGTLDVNGQTVTTGLFDSSNANVRSLTLGASTFTCAGNSSVWSLNTVTNLSFSGASSTIIVSGNTVQFAGGGLTYGELRITGAGDPNITGVNTFSTLTRTGTAVKIDTLRLDANQTVTSALNLNGNSSVNRIIVYSNTLGTARTFTITAATVSASNVDFRDITLSVSTDLSAITGGSGDGGGNTNITFTSPVTNYWVGGTGNWDTVAEWASTTGGSGGTGRVPLCQDDVVFDASSFSAGSQTVTMNMLRAGKSIDFTAATNSPTFTVTPGTAQSANIQGSLTLISAMTFNTTQGVTFFGRGNFTLTNAGKSFTQDVNINCPGGKITLQDAFNGTTINLNAGEIDANDFNVTLNTLLASNTATTRVLRMGNGTWTLTRTSGTVWSVAASTASITVAAEGSTVNISDTGASSKTWTPGNGNTYNILSIAGGGAGLVLFNYSASNTSTYNTITINSPKTIQFTAATTTVVTNFNATGTVGNVIAISSSTAATHTLSDAGGIVSCDYLNLTNSLATGGAAWYAGANSTNSGGNAGWMFRVPLVVTTPINRILPFTAVASTSSGGGGGGATATPSIVRVRVAVNSPTVRITKSAHVNFMTGISARTQLMLHMNGADGSTTFTDSEFIPKLITPAGTAQIDTAFSKFGGASGLFASGAYVQAQYDASLNIYSGDFTIEKWILRGEDGTTRGLWLNNAGSGGAIPYLIMYVNGSNLVSCEDNTGGFTLTTTTALTVASGWHHVAFVKSGSTYTIYIDGVSEASTTAANFTNPAKDFAIGTYDDTIASRSWVGNIDEFMISNYARYTANFTPSQVEFSPEVFPSVRIAVNTATASKSVRKIVTPSLASTRIIVNTAVASTQSGGGQSATATPSLKTVRVIANAAVASTSSASSANVTPQAVVVRILKNTATALVKANRIATPAVSLTRIIANAASATVSRNASVSPTLKTVRIIVNTPTLRAYANKIVTPNSSTVRVMVFQATGSSSVGGLGLSVSLLLKSKIEKYMRQPSRIEKYLIVESEI